MFGSGNGVSLADIAAVTGRNNDDGFGDGGWFWGIFLLAILFGWGGFGNGGWGGNGNAATQGALTRGDLCMDMNFQELQNGVRNINDTVNLGFANLNSTICNQQYDTAQMFNAMNISNLQSANALQSQLANCCCENRAAIAQVRYDMATDTCAIQNTLQNGFRDVIDSNNNGVRAILDKMCEYEIAGYQSTIAQQGAQIAALQGQISQNAQTASIVSQLREPVAKPAYIVPNPNAVYYGYNNCNTGCGCGQFVA